MTRSTKRSGPAVVAVLGMILAASTVLADGMDDMNGMPGMPSGTEHAPADSTVGHAKGIIDAIDRKAGTVTITHGPIREFGWKGMTMTFDLRDRSAAKSLKKGEPVTFDVILDPRGSAVITKIGPAN